LDLVIASTVADCGLRHTSSLDCFSFWLSGRILSTTLKFAFEPVDFFEIAEPPMAPVPKSDFRDCG